MAKTVRQEPDSAALIAWLNDRPDVPLVSSSLVEVEAPRALRQSAPQALSGVPSTLTRLYRLDIDNTVRATAAAYSDPMLRSLDAIHLATAQLLTDQPGSDPLMFVTYDQRLLKAAESIGLAVAMPRG